jgi:hypothetical protein
MFTLSNCYCIVKPVLSCAMQLEMKNEEWGAFAEVIAPIESQDGFVE